MKRPIKTPTILQMEATECGAASLSIILGYYGCHAPLEETRIQCGVGRDGAKISNIKKAAEKYGLKGKVTLVDEEDIFKEQAPAIIFWNHNHFIVLEGSKGDQVFLNDPAMGPRTISKKEFAEHFSQVALILEKTPDFKKRKRTHNTLKYFFDLIFKNSKNLTYVAVTTLLITIPSVAATIFSQIFIDDYLILQQHSWLNSLLAIMFVMLGLQVFLIYLQSITLKRIETKIGVYMNEKMVKHLLKLPLVFYEQRQPGDLMSRLTSNDNLAKIIAGPLGVTLVQFSQTLIYLSIMLFYSWLLGLITLGMAIINIWSYKKLKEIREKLNIENKQRMGQLNAKTVSAISSIETLKSTASENESFIKWYHALISYINSYQKISLIGLLNSLLPTLLLTLTNTAILGIGAWLVLRGQLTIGGIIAFQGLLTLFNAPIQEFVDIGGQVQSMGADFKRVEDILLYKAHENPPRTHTKIEGSIELKSVTFGYNLLDEPLLKDINLRIEPGTRVAFVGSSSCGKSTLLKLIAGLIEPWEGEILIDGVSVHQLSDEERARAISMVSQEFFFFHGSIQENLTLWDETISNEALVEATQSACAYDEIVAGKNAFSQQINDGGWNISGGQRQCLEIARTLLAKPSILLLDEATSSLDTLVEQEVDQQIRSKGYTCIISAHRLSTIKDAEQIYVMDHGKIIDQGTHDTLMKKEKSLYRDLLELQ